MLGDLQRFRIKYNQGSRFLSRMLNLHSILESNKNPLGVMDFWSVRIFETLLIQAVVRWELLLRDERGLQRSVREARAGGSRDIRTARDTGSERTQEGTGEIFRAGPGALDSQCPNGTRRLTECQT